MGKRFSPGESRTSDRCSRRDLGPIEDELNPDRSQHSRAGRSRHLGRRDETLEKADVRQRDEEHRQGDGGHRDDREAMKPGSRLAPATRLWTASPLRLAEKALPRDSGPGTVSTGAGLISRISVSRFIAGSSIGRLWGAGRHIGAIDNDGEGLADAGARASKSEFARVGRVAKDGGSFGVAEIIPKHELKDFTVLRREPGDRCSDASVQRIEAVSR